MNKHNGVSQADLQTACEEVIRQVREVLAARAVLGPEGKIDEVHVLAGPGRSPKQIVRDVESACMARLGIDLDHKKISVAQVRASPVIEPGRRLKFRGLSLGIQGFRAEARVELECDGQVFPGQAAGPASLANRNRLVAQATLAAVQECFHTEDAFSLEDAFVCQLGRRAVAMVGVSLLTRDGEEVLVGSSVVREDEREALARAALDAINRRLSWLCREDVKGGTHLGEGE